MSAKVQIANFILGKISIACTHSLRNDKDVTRYDRLEIDKTYRSTRK